LAAIRRICVFCGSRPGKRASYLEGARGLGDAIARRGLELVYGGASVGLMGALADAALAQGGKVIGVIPQRIADKEIAHRGLTELRVVDSMHTRKATMEQLSDGFIAMPGGFGTFEEVFEIITWMQLGIHQKPVGLLDVDGYYAPLRELIRHGVEEGFIPETHASAIHADPSPDALVEKLLSSAPPPAQPKWIGRDQS
jgi:uncharacterized protein (TIGR00730 family)